MKIALLMSGEIRTLEKCADSLQRCILDPLSASGAEVRIFCHAPADNNAHLAYTMLPGATVEIEPQPGFDECNYLLRSGKGVCGIQSVLAQFWGWARVLEMARAWDYDFAVRLRPDSLYYNPIETPDTWERGTCYAARFSSFWGLCDRFGYGERAVMERWLGLNQRLDEFIAEGLAFHPESLLARAIQPATVARTDVLFATVREGGNIRPPQFIREIGDVAISA